MTEDRLHLSSSGKNTSKVPKVYPITVSFKETRHRKRPRRGSLDVG